jgi:hypothetical protein
VKHASSPRRLAPALLLLPLLTAGCNASPEVFPCPGTPVATFAFSGRLPQVSCAGGAPAAGASSLYPAKVKFTGTVAYSGSSASAALCVIRPLAEPLVGAQVADQVAVELSTRGALLSGCNARCAVTVLQRVTGTVQRDPGGAPTGFTGELVDQETLDPTVTGADCAPCTTPCQATYLLTGLPQGT